MLNVHAKMRRDLQGAQGLLNDSQRSEMLLSVLIFSAPRR